MAKDQSPVAQLSEFGCGQIPPGVPIAQLEGELAMNSWQNCFVTGVIQAPPDAATETAGSAQSQNQPRARPLGGDPANDWLCVACLNRVANEKDRYLHEGKREFSFKNPEGIRFNLLLFSRTLGGEELGAPTLEHTWFPAHAWSFCVCDRCRMHLGWYYAGPSDFVGLISERIFRAALSGN